MILAEWLAKPADLGGTFDHGAIVVIKLGPCGSDPAGWDWNTLVGDEVEEVAVATYLP